MKNTATEGSPKSLRKLNQEGVTDSKIESQSQSSQDSDNNNIERAVAVRNHLITEQIESDAATINQKMAPLNLESYKGHRK